MMHSQWPNVVLVGIIVFVGHSVGLSGKLIVLAVMVGVGLLSIVRYKIAAMQEAHKPDPPETKP